MGCLSLLLQVWNVLLNELLEVLRIVQMQEDPVDIAKLAAEAWHAAGAQSSAVSDFEHLRCLCD